MLSVTSAQLDAWLAAFLWPFSRILGLMSIAPVLGHLRFPVRMRVGLAVALTLLIAPTLPPVPAVAPASLEGLWIMAVQFAVGLAIGFAVQLVFTAVEIAGELMGIQMGLGFALLYDPQSRAQVPVLGQFLGVLATLTFLGMNGHLQLVSVLVESFQHIPMSGAQAPNLAQLVTSWSTFILRAGVLLSLPVVAALLIANLALAVLTRAAPQLNIFAVGFPLTLSAGLLALLLALPAFLPLFAQLAQSVLQAAPALRAPLIP